MVEAVGRQIRRDRADIIALEELPAAFTYVRKLSAVPGYTNSRNVLKRIFADVRFPKPIIVCMENDRRALVENVYAPLGFMPCAALKQGIDFYKLVKNTLGKNLDDRTNVTCIEKYGEADAKLDVIMYAPACDTLVYFDKKKVCQNIDAGGLEAAARDIEHNAALEPPKFRYNIRQEKLGKAALSGIFERVWHRYSNVDQREVQRGVSDGGGGGGGALSSKQKKAKPADNAAAANADAASSGGSRASGQPPPPDMQMKMITLGAFVKENKIKGEQHEQWQALTELYKAFFYNGTSDKYEDVKQLEKATALDMPQLMDFRTNCDPTKFSYASKQYKISSQVYVFVRTSVPILAGFAEIQILKRKKAHPASLPLPDAFAYLRQLSAVQGGRYSTQIFECIKEQLHNIPIILCMEADKKALYEKVYEPLGFKPCGALQKETPFYNLMQNTSTYGAHHIENVTFTKTFDFDVAVVYAPVHDSLIYFDVAQRSEFIDEGQNAAAKAELFEKQTYPPKELRYDVKKQALVAVHAITTGLYAAAASGAGAGAGAGAGGAAEAQAASRNRVSKARKAASASGAGSGFHLEDGVVVIDD